MRKRIACLLALCLLLTGCGAASEGTEAKAPTAAPAQTAAPAATQPVTQGEPVTVAIQEKDTAGGSGGVYQVASSSVDPASQAYYDSLNRESEVFMAFDAAMNGNRKFTNVQTGDSMSIFSVFQHYATYETPTLRQLTVVDLEQDGVLELILWMQTSTDDRYGFVLLTYYGGEVYSQLVDYRYFQQLKTDGSFLVTQDNGSQSYARMNPTGEKVLQTYSGTAQEHEAKTDVIWYSQWLDLIYPGAAGVSGGPTGVLEESTTLYDTARQEEIHLEDVGQLLMPQEVQSRIVQCTAIDLDGDGTTETIFQIGTESDDHVGFVVLRQEQEQYIGQGYYYRTFFRLRTDGSYSFDSGASDSGYGKLVFQNGKWMEIVLAQTYENIQPDGNAYQLYFVGGEMTTEEAYNRFVEKQEAKELQSWYQNLTALNAAMG